MLADMGRWMAIGRREPGRKVRTIPGALGPLLISVDVNFPPPLAMLPNRGNAPIVADLATAGIVRWCMVKNRRWPPFENSLQTRRLPGWWPRLWRVPRSQLEADSHCSITGFGRYSDPAPISLRYDYIVQACPFHARSMANLMVAHERRRLLRRFDIFTGIWSARRPVCC